MADARFGVDLKLLWSSADVCQKNRCLKARKGAFLDLQKVRNSHGDEPWGLSRDPCKSPLMITVEQSPCQALLMEGLGEQLSVLM